MKQLNITEVRQVSGGNTGLGNSFDMNAISTQVQNYLADLSLGEWAGASYAVLRSIANARMGKDKTFHKAVFLIDAPFFIAGGIAIGKVINSVVQNYSSEKEEL